MVCCCLRKDRVEPDDDDDDDDIGKLTLKHASGFRSLSSWSDGGDFDGPQKRRSCTDLFFLLLLLAFIFVVVIAYIYCAYHGDVRRIVRGYDYAGDICSVQNDQILDIPESGKDLTNQPYLTFKSDGGLSSLDYLFNWGRIYRECTEACPTEQKPILNRCFPKEVTDYAEEVGHGVGLFNYLQRVADDLEHCWRELIYMCLIALGISSILVILMRYLAALVVWTVLVTVTCATIIGTSYLWGTYYMEVSKGSEMQNRSLTDTTYTLAIIATIVTVIVLLILLVFRKRVSLVIQLFNEAGKAITAMPSLVFQPLVTFIALVLVCGTWLIMLLVIESAGFPVKDSDNSWVYYAKDGFMKASRWINIFGLLWMTQFCIGCQHVVVAGAVGRWFFTRDKARLGYPILDSVQKLLCYHMGSVALGSMFVAVVQIMRVLVTMLERFLSKSGQERFRLLTRCCHGCLACVEKILKYINRNAYIEIALCGYGFCRAARKAFSLLVSNALRVAAINSIGDFVLFLAKASVVSITVISGFEMLKGRQLAHMWVPLLIAGIIAYFISHCFFCVYEMAIDTIFLCFCEDMEQNNGTSRPYYMSKGLMEFVENSKRAIDYTVKKRNGREEAWSETNQQYTPPFTITNNRGTIN